MSKVAFEDFVVEGLLQEGAWGKVFAAKRATDGHSVALKFFGYAKNRPNAVDIANEIRTMSQLIGVEGSVQLVGVFKDSPEGLLPGKNPEWQKSFPVIVMEMLSEGDVLSYLATSKHISEKTLADLFRSIVDAVSSVHKKGFIHRDIKLCNLMISSKDPLHTKMIDFGFMMDLNADANRTSSSISETVVTDTLVGTEGFFAPESITKCEYSRMTDLWQLGCVLYTMLVGYHPFSTQKRYRADILNGAYFPLTSAEWQPISSSAKDLVSKLLLVKSCDRLSIEEILKHPWIRSCESCGLFGVGLDSPLGEAYHERIKLLGSRRGVIFLPCHDADSKPSSTAVGSAEKKQKRDHNQEGISDLDYVKLNIGDRSPSPDLPRRSDPDGKSKAEDRFCSSPVIEKNSSEESPQIGR